MHVARRFYMYLKIYKYVSPTKKMTVLFKRHAYFVQSWIYVAFIFNFHPLVGRKLNMTCETVFNVIRWWGQLPATTRRWLSKCKPYNAGLLLYTNYMENKGVFQIEIIINVLVSFLRFIWIPMLWVYDHYTYFYSDSAGIDCRRQNLTSTDVWFWRLK